MSPWAKWAGSALQLIVISTYEFLCDPVLWHMSTLPVHGVTLGVLVALRVAVVVTVPVPATAGVPVRVAVTVTVGVEHCSISWPLISPPGKRSLCMLT